jgi:hypothetical protein
VTLDEKYAKRLVLAEGLEAADPPRPLLHWRDQQHQGCMLSGVCVRCFGFADDPRHNGACLVRVYGDFASFRATLRGVV